MRNNLLFIVEKEQTRDVLHRRLHHEYNLFVAHTMDEIFQVFEKASIQLIICSVNRNAPDGWDVCTQCKTSPRYAHIPVILLAGEDSLKSKIKALEVGADAYLGGQVSWKYLDALIKNLIINRLKISRQNDTSCLEHNNIPDLQNDDDLIKKLNNFIYRNLHDRSLSVDMLAKFVNMSRPTLYRKINTITELTPNKLISLARLKKAAEQLGSGEHKIFEIAQMVGFQSQSSFGKAFLKKYKVTPATYQHIKKKQRIQNSNNEKKMFLTAYGDGRKNTFNIKPSVTN